MPAAAAFAGVTDGESMRGVTGAAGAAETGAKPAGSGAVANSAPVTMKPADKAKAAKAAISTVGSFFGKVGLIAGLAREMMRASGGAALMLSRAVASRYLAR